MQRLSELGTKPGRRRFLKASEGSRNGDKKTGRWSIGWKKVSSFAKGVEGVKANGKIAGARRAADPAGPGEPHTVQLARLIDAYAPHDGSFELGLPGVHASRFSRVNRECVHALRVSSLCIVAQGAKTVIVGDEVYEFDSSRMIVFSVALPVAAQITQA